MELTVNGHTVLATTGGRPLDPGLPLLVFIHGSALDRTVWQLQTRYFSHHGYSVLAVDLPGHGGSAGEPPDSIEGYADWIGDLVIAAGYEAAHVVGHSMGSLIALETAARHPDRVETLVLTGAVAAMPVHPELIAAAEAGDHLAFELMTSWGHGRVSHLGGHQTPGLWMVGSTLRLWERSRSGVLASGLHACNNYTHGPDAAIAVRCPTLLVTGAIDVMAPSAGAQPLRDHIVGVEEVVIPGAGHIMMIESPDPVIDSIAEFLGRHAS